MVHYFLTKPDIGGGPTGATPGCDVGGPACHGCIPAGEFIIPDCMGWGGIIPPGATPTDPIAPGDPIPLGAPMFIRLGCCEGGNPVEL